MGQIYGVSGMSASPVNSITANGFRLTLTSGLPVTVADIATATTIYFTPYTHNTIGLYDGSSWRTKAYSEAALVLSGLTANLVYDVFAYDAAGVLTLEAVAWASTSARDKAIERLAGVWIKSIDPTKRYVGTFRTLSATETADSDEKRYLWNVDNRVSRNLRAQSTTATYTLASATAWRLAENSQNNKAYFVTGLSEDSVFATNLSCFYGNNVSLAAGVSIGLDALTPHAYATSPLQAVITINNDDLSACASLSAIPGIGAHYLARLEMTVGTGTVTFDQNYTSGAYRIFSQLTAHWRC